jgi:glycosyltransferase involved in cell wall biosynthesis
VADPTWPYRFQYTRRQQWGEFHKHRTSANRVSWFDLRCRLLRVPLVRALFLPRADIVIASAWPTVHDVAALPASRGRKAQIVFHHESGTGPEYRIRAIYALPFYRIAFSRFVRDSVRVRFGCQVDAVVANGVDTGLFFPDGAPDQQDVLFLYHPDPRKGGDDGVAALTRLRARRPGLRVAVCGTVRPGSWPATLPFEFHPDDATAAAPLLRLDRSSVSQPLRRIRAASAGSDGVRLPAGDDRCRRGSRIRVDRTNALVAPVGDIDAMVDRLGELLGDAALRPRLSAAGLETAAQYSLTRVAPLFTAALEDALRF